MPHNNSYLSDTSFNLDGTSVKVPFHDSEALHDEDNAVKGNHIAAGAITASKLAEKAVGTAALADGCVGMEQLGEDVKENWDSRTQILQKCTTTFGVEGATSRVQVAHDLVSIDGVYEDGAILSLSAEKNGTVAVWYNGIKIRII